MEEKLLQQAYEKSKDYLYEDSSRFNLLSIIEKDRDEAHIHSKIIYNLLSQNWGKKDKETFLTLFLKEIGIEDENIYDKNWEVTREKAFDLDTIKGRLDFEIKSKDCIYIIEMKIDAGDQPEQLIRYQKFAKEQHKKYKIFYLTLDGHNASKKSIGEEENLEENEKVEYINISFQGEILNWLENCLKLVEGKENKSACISQYIASINKILGEKDTKIKDNILKSTEDIKTAITIYEKLNDKLQKVLKNFFEELNKKLKNKLKDITSKPIYNESYIKDYYNYTLDKIPQDYPGLYIVLDENKSNNSNYYKFVLKLELAPELIGCLGFIKSDEDVKETIPFVYFSQVKKNSSGLYNRCIKRIENLESKDKLSDNNKAYWFYVKNLKEEIINFKDISLSNKALLSLIDEETLKEEVKNIATYISNEIVKNMEI
ncbi:PD-(D/E)XK nuclease family protein [Fusobacterium polymorphum]|uniref:PDDEXK-like family protein n=1 Tax=Fusobacterium nucleatum subsp. polymorphum TaxID=76857 RepID=UPI001EEF81BB|nr:PD-(D/E)XK nuclease family protein [Fusobacterium nucleatum]MCG6838230.1 PD-(D/E)XK nuclease family protein [Fusobacterium nucleatum]